jgi:hypothetical protein
MYINKTYNTVHMVRSLSDAFPTQNSLKEGEDLSPFSSSFDSECVTTKVQETQEGLKLNKSAPGLCRLC